LILFRSGFGVVSSASFLGWVSFVKGGNPAKSLHPFIGFSPSFFFFGALWCCLSLAAFNFYCLWVDLFPFFPGLVGGCFFFFFRPVF